MHAALQYGRMGGCGFMERGIIMEMWMRRAWMQGSTLYVNRLSFIFLGNEEWGGFGYSYVV